MANERSFHSDKRELLVRELILQAALHAISEKGYHGTSVRDISGKVGCSISTIYNFFPSKQALLTTLIDDIVEALGREVADSLQAAPDDPASQLAAAVGAHVRVHAERPAESFIAASEIRSLEVGERDRYIKQRDTYERIFRDIVERGVSVGAFTTPEPREASRAILIACTGVASWYRSDGDLSVAAIADRYVVLALAMVGHKPPRSRTAKR